MLGCAVPAAPCGRLVLGSAPPGCGLFEPGSAGVPALAGLPGAAPGLEVLAGPPAGRTTLTVCAGGSALGLLPCTKLGIGVLDCGTGACVLTTGDRPAARCACAGTDVLTAAPLIVAEAGAMIVTLVTFVTFVMLVVLLTVVLPTLALIRIPTAMTGGALVTTAGAVPIGAGTMMPGREPGGAGTKQPSGPEGRGPTTTPAAATSSVRWMPGGGGWNTTPGAAQWPLTKITTPPRFS